MAGCNVREAKRTDAGNVYKLMQQHAAEHNTVLPPHLTLEALEEGGWGPSAVFLACVAECEGGTEGELQGYVLAHRTYSTWEGRAMCIREVFVIPAARQSGVARQLCRRLLQAALDLGCARCDVLLDKGNKVGVTLFEKLGAQNLTEAEDWHFFSMDKKAMEKMEAGSKAPEPVRVRPASPKDFPGIRTMIQELADYEKMPEGPKIDANTMLTDSSPLGHFFESFVAESNESLLGYMLLYHTFSSKGRGIYMEDLYVRPDHRHQGLGSALMAQAAQRGLTLGASYLQFSVLGWNTPSIGFYLLKGATDLTAGQGIQVYRFVEAAMRKCVEK